MRAINIFIFCIFLHGCASIEVAEVVTKTSIKVAEKVADAKTLISGSKETEDNNEEVAISQKQSEIINSELIFVFALLFLMQRNLSYKHKASLNTKILIQLKIL